MAGSLDKKGGLVEGNSDCVSRMLGGGHDKHFVLLLSHLLNATALGTLYNALFIVGGICALGSQCLNRMRLQMEKEEKSSV